MKYLLIFFLLLLCEEAENATCSVNDANLHLRNTSQGIVIYNNKIPDENCKWRLPVPTNRSALLLRLLNINMTYLDDKGEEKCSGYLYYPQKEDVTLDGKDGVCRKQQLPNCVIYTAQSSGCTAQDIKDITSSVGLECLQFALQVGGNESNIMTLTTKEDLAVWRRLKVEYKHTTCTESGKTITSGGSDATTLAATPTLATITSRGSNASTLVAASTLARSTTNEMATISVTNEGGTSRPSPTPKSITGYFISTIALSVLLALCLLAAGFWGFRRARDGKREADGKALVLYEKPNGQGNERGLEQPITAPDAESREMVVNILYGETT